MTGRCNPEISGNVESRRRPGVRDEEPVFRLVAAILLSVPDPWVTPSERALTIGRSIRPVQNVSGQSSCRQWRQCSGRSPGMWAPFPRRPRQLRHPQTSQGIGLAGAPSALDFPFHPDLGVLAQRGGELLLQDDAAAHPPRCLPLGCRPAGGDQCLSYRTQCQPQTLRLDEIRRGHSGQARPLPCTIRLSHCTSRGAAPTNARADEVIE